MAVPYLLSERARLVLRLVATGNFQRTMWMIIVSLSIPFAHTRGKTRDNSDAKSRTANGERERSAARGRKRKRTRALPRAPPRWRAWV